MAGRGKRIAGARDRRQNIPMCGRYALYGPHSRLTEKLLLASCPEYGPRYNIAPQSQILVIRGKPGTGRVGQLVQWGLIPAWARDATIGARLNNARAETVAEKPAFRASFARHRCIIPANGFYEWQVVGAGGKTRRQPWFVCPPGTDDFFALAGLLALWRSPAGAAVISACVITTAANAVMAAIHERMPVLLEPADYDTWLDPDNDDRSALQGLLAPCLPERLRVVPVDPAINRGGMEGPQCIVPIGAESP